MNLCPNRVSAVDMPALKSSRKCASFGAGTLEPRPLLLLIIALALPSIACAARALSPVALRCEYLESPLGIDEPYPRLTWRVESVARGQKQSAYRILVAGDERTLDRGEGDLWDLGKVASEQTVNVAYAGKALTSRQSCFWKVKVWDQDGRASDWSKSSGWSMGLLKPDDWKAQYISFHDTTPVFKDAGSLFLPPARQYRKEFDAAKTIRRAMIYATALGIYELHLNGQRVGDSYFAPGWCDYRQRAYYNTYDVTPLMKRGANAIGAWVADGWYSGYIGFGLLTGIGTEHIGRYTYGKTPAIMAQLEIEYADGSHETVVTDASWKVTSAGPIQQADFLMGESYDARNEMRGWDEAGFRDGSGSGAGVPPVTPGRPALEHPATNAGETPGVTGETPAPLSQWEPAIRAEENGSTKATFYEFQNPTAEQGLGIRGREVDLGFKPPPRLEAFPGLPVRHVQEIKSIAITSPTNDVYIFNLGQNFAGVARLKVKGPAGTKIRLRYGEMLHPDGRLMTENLRKARATDFYILRGDSDGETYIPRFTFHGFQYVELTGYPGKPDLGAITGLVLQSDTPMASEFECSDPMVNQLFKNIVWTQRANFLDLPTDCPQRDERFGWTGDAQIYVRAATYNADVTAFYSKWLRELMESQRPSGTFPGYAPFPFQHGWDFGTAWCDAGVICPWTIYKAYGDTRIIERCWEPMVRFMVWRQREGKNYLGVVHGNEWGDWLAVNEKKPQPLDYIDTVYFAYTAKLMSEMALAIGKTGESAEYGKLFDHIKVAFNKKYVHLDGTLAVETQTAYALALYMDLLPENLRLAAGAELARKIRDNDTRMATGFLGTRPLLPVLSSAGQNDLAVQLLQSRKYPSWGYEIEQGATTIWERWNSYTKDKGFGGEQNASMNSFAHYSFGAVCEWMFSGLAGIDTDGPGYKRLIIRPMPPSPNSNPDQPPINQVRAHYDSIHGRISSAWKRAGERFELQVTIPANTTATVYLPAVGSASITEDGRKLADATGVKFLRMEGDRAVLSVQSGAYRFSSKAGL